MTVSDDTAQQVANSEDDLEDIEDVIVRTEISEVSEPDIQVQHDILQPQPEPEQQVDGIAGEAVLDETVDIERAEARDDDTELNIAVTETETGETTEAEVVPISIQRPIPAPRCGTRKKVTPDRYGDWIMSHVGESAKLQPEMIRQSSQSQDALFRYLLINKMLDLT